MWVNSSPECFMPLQRTFPVSYHHYLSSVQLHVITMGIYCHDSTANLKVPEEYLAPNHASWRESDHMILRQTLLSQVKCDRVTSDFLRQTLASDAVIT